MRRGSPFQAAEWHVAMVICGRCVHRPARELGGNPSRWVTPSPLPLYSHPPAQCSSSGDRDAAPSYCMQAESLLATCWQDCLVIIAQVSC